MKYKKLYDVWVLVRNNQSLWLFTVFAVIIFSKLLWFQGTLLSWEEYDSSWRIMTRLLPKVSIAMFIASFLFVTKRSWWTIPVSIAVDIWAIANVIYYRACGFFINADALQMADNMHGFWGSISIFFTWKELVPVLITLLYAVFIVRFGKKKRARQFCLFVVVLLISFALRIYVNYYHHKYVLKDSFNREGLVDIVRPILDSQYDSYLAARNYFYHGFFSDWEKQYINHYSIVDYFFADISYYLTCQYFAGVISDSKHQVPIEPSDKKIIEGLISGYGDAPVPRTNLVVILFESLEGWIFENYEGSENIAPNLKKLIDKENVLYAPRTKSQVQQGNSGDGQMIVMTGVLPLKVGAACRLYGSNSYPNYAHLFRTSATINPSPGAWNQREVNPNYGISRLDEFSGDDDQLVDSLIEAGNNAKSPFFLLGITVNSHSPFNSANFAKLKLSSDMPKTLQNYLTCINSTDKAIGKLISKIETDPQWTNTTLVIVGDHVVFKEQMLDEFSEYAQKADISLKSKKNYVPLIIYSPTIASKVKVDEVVYQSDIYPTILNIIGCESYYWKGVGANILAKDGINRLDEDTGYRISDIIIRNSYFDKFREFNK